MTGLADAGERAPLHHAALYALALGTFAVGTEGFMIAALLPMISRSIAVSIAAAGQLVTVFALVYAVSSPLLTALTAAMPRRQLLMISLGAFAASNIAAALAPGYWPLAGARVLLALTAGLYVPNANALAGALAAPHHRGRALAIVNGGITVAIAIGVPLGAIVGAQFGWRATFMGVALLSVAALVVLAVLLPRDFGASPPAGLRERLAVIAAPGAFPVLLTTTLWAVAAYTVYTYISPYLSAAANLASGQIGLVLMVYGISALAGVTLGGIGVDRVGSRKVQAIALPVMALAFFGLTAIGVLRGPGAISAIVGAVVVWGVSAWSFFPAQQNRLIGVVGLANTPVILSLNASFMYFGFALGAVLGSLVISTVGVVWIGLAGALSLGGAMAMSRFAWGREAG
ncbi:MFS transporter [Novosphingobium sp.]|uniref:MFS transporter n=1 Tax=Novosphingobium sp. TaxID=1874826 RepID=UPI003BA9BFF0